MKGDIVISSLVEWMYWMFRMFLVSNRFQCCDVVAGFGYLVRVVVEIVGVGACELRVSEAEKRFVVECVFVLG